MIDRASNLITSALRIVTFIAVVFVSLVAQTAPPNAAANIAASDPKIQYIGRYDDRNPSRRRIGYPGVTIRFRFTATSAVVHLDAETENIFVTSIVDGGAPQIHHLAKGPNDLTLTAAPSPSPHDAQIVKRTETWQGVLNVLGLTLAAGGKLTDPLPLPRRKLMFIGDSVTCGAGVDQMPKCESGMMASSNAYDAYGLLLGRRLDAESHLVCYGGRGLIRDYRGVRNVVNAPQFFDLALVSDDPKQSVPWNHARFTPDAIVVSLGTNDWGKQKEQPLTRDEFVNTYVKFVRTIRSRYPKAKIFLTEGAIVADPLLRSFVREAADKIGDPHVRWIAAQHYPGLACDAHPIKSEHYHIADDLEPVLRRSLGW